MGGDPLRELPIPPGRFAVAGQFVERRGAAERIGRVALGNAVDLDPRGPLGIVPPPRTPPSHPTSGGQIIRREIDGKAIAASANRGLAYAEDDVGVLDVRGAGQGPQRVARHPVDIEAALASSFDCIFRGPNIWPAWAGKMASGNCPSGRWNFRT